MDTKPALESLSKKQLVKAINMYPGDKVTTRPKKSVLQDVLRQRIQERLNADALERKTRPMPPVETKQDKAVWWAIVIAILGFGAWFLFFL